MYRYMENGYEWAVAPGKQVPEELAGKGSGESFVANPEGWCRTATVGALAIYVRKVPPLRIVADQETGVQSAA